MEQKIIQGDAMTLLKEIPSESIDVIIADPPYNLGKNYGNNHDFKEFDDYISFSKTWLGEAKRILKST
ncbi:MAG: site-specific DNA-methyltransferase, partial [Gammaproteobacteria bacterium]